ncbi:hypothetical protein B0H12DRAFT_1305430 [Mycena haematopus]|nr:hypothetical protein B0H12DRAFT_1078657 [Mycena haematopus]KAJ7219718.1 hypothetical protein B0H12DRAFT_1241458 [Mycena haematopus]KAJ7225248.1 hypothetical protein B0H12DRAFT_1240683 [Mycena haematopus]KAJ7246844.1 hypothetical protein B0H12DRAFT_1305430 [Mycena haematopus]
MSVAWTPAEDKAFKREALRCVQEQATFSNEVDAWVDHYRATPHNKANSWVDLDLPAERKAYLHQHKRAQIVARVVARKARVDHVLDLRKRAIQASAKKWPRPPCHPHHQENVDRLEKEHQQAAAHQAAEHARERAAADARVKNLMRLRAEGLNRRRKLYY